MDPNTTLLIVIVITVVILIVISALYAFKITPYTDKPQIKDPRDWKAPEDLNQWKTPILNTGSTNRNVPDPEIAQVYCQFDPSKCEPDRAVFDQNPPTSFC